MTEEGIEKPKPHRPPKVDRPLLGAIQVIAFGSDGKSGIEKRAREVRQLEKQCDVLRSAMAVLEGEIEELKAKMPLGEVVGGLAALFTGKFADLEAKKTELEGALGALREQSTHIVEEMETIDEKISEYLEKDSAYQAAQSIQEFLDKMKVFAGLCRNAAASVNRLRTTGTQAEVRQAEGLRDRNTAKLNEALEKYWGIVQKNPRWAGMLPLAVDARTIDGLSQGIGENQGALKEKMQVYRNELKESLPNDIQPFVSEKEKEFFRNRSNPEWTGE